MKRTARILLAVAAVLVVAVTTGTILYFSLRKPAPKWVSWRLEEEEVRSLEKLLPPPKNVGETVIQRLDPNASLESQAGIFSRSAILFTFDGLEAAWLK